MSNDDSVWKEILDASLEEFLEFFFPPIHRDIDWPRGYECLDQELEPILRDGPFRERRVDALAVLCRRIPPATLPAPVPIVDDAGKGHPPY
jgi:hypothetical protein